MSATDTASYEPIELEMATVNDLLFRFQSRGPNKEYRQLEERLGLGVRRSLTNYWQYIKDAVDGTGGYTNGFYLYPHRLEIEANTNIPSMKLKIRRDQADYDNFAKDICYAAWDQIVQSKDLIVRKANTDTDQGKQLDTFWKDVDRRGTSIMEFLEFAHKQARSYGTGYIVMDRPRVEFENADESGRPENMPYVYVVPSVNVVEWSFDDDKNLNGLVIVEPLVQPEISDIGSPMDNPSYVPHNLRIWTNETWALFQSSLSKDSQGQDMVVYTMIDGAPNGLGEIPMVPLYNDDPGPLKMIGHSEMIDVARLAQTVYNVDSEIREIQRKCALFLALPVKDAKEFDGKTAQIGNESMFAYDGEAGKPEWISPDLHSMKELKDTRREKIESAYAMAHLRVLVGNIQTKSGFHAEVEFQKTERRIARHAYQLEACETKIARLFMKFLGLEDTHNDGSQYEIVYPREYGVRDIEKVIQRTEILPGMDLGDDLNRVALEQMYKVLYSRKSPEDIQTMVDSSIKALNAAAQQEMSMKMGGAAGGASGQTGPTSKQRVQTLLGRISASTATNDLREAL